MSKQERWHERNPWAIFLVRARQRCYNPKHRSYPQYGERGIQVRVTLKDLELVWHRDDAVNLKRPSLDRIDPDGHYELGNIRFIEWWENAGRSRARTRGAEPVAELAEAGAFT